MKLLEAVELKPSRAAMEVALDEMDWGGIGTDNDAFFAVFRAAFRREKKKKKSKSQSTNAVRDLTILRFLVSSAKKVK